MQLVNQQLPHAVKRVNSGRVREYTHTDKQYLLDDWDHGDEGTRWGYEQMERKRKERYGAALTYECDEDEDGDEWDEKQLLEAERLVEQLQECEDTEADSDENKENRPPHAASSFSWESECTAVQRLAEEAEARKQQRRSA